MKRPGLYLAALFISIIGSAVVVSTVVSGVARSFHKENSESVNAKAPVSQDMRQASVKF